MPNDAVNPYADLIQSDVDAQSANDVRFKASTALALDANPDQVAKTRQQAAYLGVNPGAAEALPEDISRRAAVKQIDEHTADAPALRRKYTEQDFAKLAHDDSFSLSQIEKGLRVFLNGGAMKEAPGKVGSALAEGAKQLVMGGTVGLGAGIFDAAALPLDLLSFATKGILPQDIPGRIAADYRGRAKAARGAMDEVSAKPEGNLAKGIQSGLRSTGQNLAMLPLGVARGAEMLVGAMASTVGAQAYSEARDKGMDPIGAMTYALPHGVFEYAFEKLPALYLLDDMAKHAGLVQLVKHQILSEVPGEQATTLLQDFNDWARLNPEKTTKQFIEERPDQAIQTLVATLVGVGAQSGIVRGTQKILGGAAEREARVNEANNTAASLKEMFALATDNKLRERDPASFADFVQSAADEHANDSTPGEVFVDGQVLAQSMEAAGITPEQFAQLAPLAAEQLSQVAPGGDVAIPIGELVGKLTGTGLETSLLQHLRATPEALSQAEAKEAAGKAQEFWQQQADAVLADAQQGEALRASGEVVRADIHDQLAKANRFTKDVNEAYAKLVEAFYVVTGQRLGLSAEQLYNEYPLLIGAERVKGDSIAQEAKAARYQKALLGERKLEDLSPEERAQYDALGAEFAQAAGKPGTYKVYRGVRVSGPNDHGAAGKGEYWSGRKQAAEAYGKVKEGEVSLSNALMLDYAELNKLQTDLYGQVVTGFDAELSANFDQWLRDQGYDGVVLFDPEISTTVPEEVVKLAPKTLKQGPETAARPRGTYNPSQIAISLLQNADLSTFLHESGHFFLDVLGDIASQPNAPADVQADMAALLKWFGVADLDTWRAMTLDQQRPFHEKFAQSFEQYLFEGKTPNTELSSLFARFRAWLTNVYTSLKEFVSTRPDLELSDEVRGVMDRLIATDEQIAQAEAARGYAQAFASAEAAGMTPAQWAAYQGLAADATQAATEQLQRRSLREMRWLTGARSKALRELQKDAKEKRAAVEAEVRAEVEAEPVYQAQAFIDEARAPTAADKQAVKEWKDKRAAHEEQVTEKVKAALLASPEAQGLKGLEKGQYLARNKKAAANVVQRQMIGWETQNPKPQRALPPIEADVIGERFGFRSGDEMLRALADAQPIKQVIEGMTDQRMLERYGDLATQEGLQRAADKAVHNDARAKFVATELAALNKKLGKPNVIIKAAREFAQRLVAGRKIRDLKPGQHTAAETRAAKRAMQALAKGDSTAAATAKRDQILSHYAARETSAAVEEVQKDVAYLKRLGEGPRGVDNGYQDQIDKLLERFDLRTSTSLKEIDRRASLAEWLEAQAEMGIEPDLPAAVLQEAYSKSYKELTVDEFRGLVDSVRQLEHLGRLKDKLLTAKDQREFNAVKDMIVASIDQHAGNREADTRTPNTVLGGALVGLKRFWSAHIKAATWARVMDGGKDGGPVWEYIIRPANAAGDKEITMRAKATRDLAALLKPVLAQGPMGGKGQYFASIDRSLNREAVLAIALNTGNESNTQRLLGGEGWNMAQLEPVLKTLTATDWAFVQKVWDYFESYRPEIAAKEKRVSGKEPTWLDPAPRDVALANGDTVKLKGGYYPVKYDPRASERAEAFADAETAKAQMKGAFTSATTRRSFTKARAEEVRGRPLLYSLDGLYNGVNEVIHDLSWHEFLIDANRLVKNKAIAATVRGKYGPDAHQQFKSWLQDVAAGEVASHNAGERALGWVRQGVSISGLGFNIMSALIQPLGITQSIVRVGPKWVGKGMATYIAAPLASADSVFERSDFMRTRAMTRFRELAEVKAQVKGRTKAREMVDGGAYYMMLRAQQMVDIPTWLGAYEKAVVEGGNGEERAIALADQAVIDAQGSGSLKDLSSIERGGPGQKLFTTFYSFFNTALNLGVGQTMTAESKAKLAADYLLLFVVPVVLGALMKSAVIPGDSGDWEDPEKIAKTLIGEEISYLFGLMFGVREMSGAAQALTGTAKYGTDYSGPAGLRLITETGKLAKQVNQGEADDALRKAIINTAGNLLRLPAAQINRSITGAQALADGKTQNPMALIMGYQEPH